MWTDNLRHFHFWCQKTLPLVYDDSLSYYEVLAKVTRHLNELTTLVNEIGDELERYEGVTDDRLDALETWRTEVNTWREQIDQWKADINTWVEQTDEWKQSTENHLTAHDNWISYATGLINNTIMPFIDDMTARVADIETVLNSEYTYLGTVNYNSTDDRVYITLNTSTSCDKLQALVDFEEKSDISRLNHKPVFYITFDSDVISHFENEQYPVDSRIYFQDLNADVFTYMKQGSNDIILDGLAIVMSDYNTLKTVKSGVTYRAFYIGNGLYYSFENVGTDIENRLIGVENDIDSIEGRLDDAEDDVTDLQNRMSTAENKISTAEDGIVKIEKRAFIIYGVVTYDSTNNIWLLEIGSPWDATFIRTNVDNSDYLLSTISKQTQFIFSIGSSGYNYDNLVLSYGLTPLTYNGQNIVIDVVSPSTNAIWYSDFDTSADTFILDTMPSNAAKINRFVGSAILSLPKPTQNDDGKVVAYNNTTKKYELIPPTGGSSHVYSTTEQEVGVWIDGTTKVYERVLPFSSSSSVNGINLLNTTAASSIRRIISSDLWIENGDATRGGSNGFEGSSVNLYGYSLLKNPSYGISVWFSGNVIAPCSGYVIICYTKT